MPLRQWKKVQEVLREVMCGGLLEQPLHKEGEVLTHAVSFWLILIISA